MQLLPYLDLHFRLRVHGPVPDLPFLGPTVRGLLGYGLRQTCCGHDADARGACRLGESCTYAYLFEGPLQLRDSMRRLTLDALPQPFLPLVDPPDRDRGMPAQAGAAVDAQTVRFGIRLIGTACELAPAVIDAIAARERFGFGARSWRYTVEAAGPRHATTASTGSRATPAPSALPSGGAALRLSFVTPTALTGTTSRHDLLGAALIDSAAARLWLLEQAYGVGGPRRSIPRAASPADFRTISVATRPWSLTRRSTRHGRVTRLEGAVGEAIVEGPWHRHSTLLAAIERYGVGRNITFGFGRIRTEVLRSETNGRHSAAQPQRDAGSLARAARLPRWIRLRGAPPARPHDPNILRNDPHHL